MSDLTRGEQLKAQWAAGTVAMGAWLSVPSTVSAEAVGRTGFDYVTIDTQHGVVDYSMTVPMLQVLGLGASVPLVRVPWNEPGIIGKMLDAGAAGVIVPMVNTPSDASAVVSACHYAPAGARSHGPTLAALGVADYYHRSPASTVVIPMIETVEAVENLDAILAVPGIDAIYVGPADLSISLGLPPGNNDDAPTFAAALERIVACCRSAGVVPGIHANAGLAQRRVAQGFRMITVSADLLALRTQVAADLALARSGAADGDGAPGGSLY